VFYEAFHGTDTIDVDETFFSPEFLNLLEQGFGPRAYFNPKGCYEAYLYWKRVKTLLGQSDNRSLVEAYEKIVDDRIVVSGSDDNTTYMRFIRANIVAVRDLQQDQQYTAKPIKDYFSTITKFVKPPAANPAVSTLLNPFEARERARIETCTVDVFEDDYRIRTKMSEHHHTVSDNVDIEDFVSKIVNKGDKSTCDKDDQTLSLYQSIVIKTIRPRGPIKKLVVNHRVGAGKTRSMTSIFNNYDKDPRARLLLFSSDVLLNQFFGDLLAISSPTTSNTKHIKRHKKDISLPMYDYLENMVTSGMYESKTNGEPKSPFLYNGIVHTESRGPGVVFDDARPQPEDNELLYAPVYATTYDGFENMHYPEEQKDPGDNMPLTRFLAWGKLRVPIRKIRQHDHPHGRSTKRNGISRYRTVLGGR
jgi:hypothetical protein